MTRRGEFTIYDLRFTICEAERTGGIAPGKRVQRLVRWGLRVPASKGVRRLTWEQQVEEETGDALSIED